MKRFIALFLAAIMLLSAAPVVFAAETGIETLKINPYGGGENDMDAVSWFASGTEYFIFLPSDADMTAAKVYYTAAGEVTIDGEPVASGESAAAFTEGAHTLSCGGQSCPIQVMFGTGLPSVFLTTESGSLSFIEADKANKEPGSIRIYENGTETLDGDLKQIKGRGNATWNYIKKPYNIKFNKKTGILGMPKAKKWTLLASYSQDNALMKNAFALDFGRAEGLNETSECRHVNLYINGEYRGVYLICESVEIGDNRVDITDLEKANEDANPDIEDIEALPLMGIRSGYVPGSTKWVDIPASPENISGGYLLEMDYLYRYHAEASGFISNIGAPMVIGSPEYASKAEVDYISALWNEAEEALYSPTGRNNKEKYYTEYFDMDSLVRCYIAEELTKDVDSGITSFYFYKKADDDVFYAGPLWDFDHALGSGTTIGDKLTVYEPDTWYANQLHRNSIDTSCNSFATFFAQCYSFADFRSSVSRFWENTASAAAGEICIPALSSLRDTLTPSAVMNHLRWNTYSSTDPDAVETRYLQEANSLISFLSERKPMLDKGFAVDGALVVYNGNGAPGKSMYDGKIYSIGETARARSNKLSYEGKIFAGWNTAADGSGEAIAPGGNFTLTQQYTVLYAMWDDETEEPSTEEQPTQQPSDQDGGSQSIWDLIVLFFQRIINFFKKLFS
ncbi:MAG: CotH kinase family protein [Clostridia bacterium]|nr:CotH kinase family protein [Clostridia bacterium]